MKVIREIGEEKMSEEFWTKVIAGILILCVLYFNREM